MKKWLNLTCPVCGFRYPLTKFKPKMSAIVYPLQIVTGGGRAKGFKVEKYLPWSTLPKLRQTNAWNSLLCLYNRLGAAYDQYYLTLGFLSPEIKKILQALQGSYPDAYRTSKFQEYAHAYASTQPAQDIVDAYSAFDYPEAYAQFLKNQFLEGVLSE